MWDIDTNLYESWDELDNINNESTEQVKLVLVEADKLTKEAELAEMEQPEADIEIPDNIEEDLAMLVYQLKKDHEIVINKTKDKAIIEAAIEATKKFSGSGKESKWVYQLQLLINAYISESAILKALNNKSSNLITELSNMSVTKDRPNLNMNDKIVSFNDPDSHKRIFNAPNAAFENNYSLAKANKKQDYNKFIELDRQKSDLCAKDSNGNTQMIEIKVTKNTQPKNFHSADIVLICDLGTNDMYVKCRRANGTYTNRARIDSIEKLLPGIQFVEASSDSACFKLV